MVYLFENLLCGHEFILPFSSSVEYDKYFPQIESKIVVGLGGVSIVLLAVSSSLGIYGFIGVEATLFVIEVGIE